MIRLRTLGALDLRGPDGQQLGAVVAQPKRIALLCYLALATPRGPHRRDTLLALFWPEHDAERARNSLSQSVHVLRRALGADTLVTRSGDAVSLEWKDLWCDAVAFEEALNGGRLAEAVELYHGDLLTGFHLGNAPEFERWLEGERERLARRQNSALEQLAEQRESAGDFGGAVIWWRRAGAVEPFNSRLALRLMRALAEAGDAAAAINHARVHEKLLREELDAAPNAEVLELARLLQSGTWKGLTTPVRAAAPAMIATHSADDRKPPTRPRPPTEPGRAAGRRSTAVLVAALLVLTIGASGVVALTASGRTRFTPSIHSLAVLPFENLSGDSAWQSFADGMHDALITELARYPDLSVISRTSVVRYRGTSERLPDIARELNVDAVVEGSVLREGGRVRLNAQLVHGPSDRHVWAQSYKRDLRDILVLQGELAEAIAREVRVAVVPPEQHRLTSAGPADSVPRELYLRELYLRGRHAELSRSLVGMQTAKEHYRRAIERDSTFALGYAGLAGAYRLMADYAYVPVRPALDTARMLARQAMALNSDLPEARTALALTLADAGEFEAAERELKRAIELGPSNASAHYWYSMLLVILGRGEPGLREARRAAELDPFGPGGVIAVQRYALWLVTGERPHLKLPVEERRPILKLEPGQPWARARDALELAEEGRCAEARSDILRAQQLVNSDNMQMRAFLGAVYWLCGERARARSLVDEMKRHPQARAHGFQIALLHTRFAEPDSAFVWLERQNWQMSELLRLSAEQHVDRLRSDPRFAQLLERIGIRPRRTTQN